MTATIDYRNHYGAEETNGLIDGHSYHTEKVVNWGTLSMLAKAGGKVTRVRILSEYVPQVGGRWYDLSYVDGTLPDGTVVGLLGFERGGVRRELKKDLIEWAKSEGVYAKGIGLLDELNWSELR